MNVTYLVEYSCYIIKNHDLLVLSKLRFHLWKCAPFELMTNCWRFKINRNYSAVSLKSDTFAQHLHAQPYIKDVEEKKLWTAIE